MGCQKKNLLHCWWLTGNFDTMLEQVAKLIPKITAKNKKAG
jgi:hypothetical protein